MILSLTPLSPVHRMGHVVNLLLAVFEDCCLLALLVQFKIVFKLFVLRYKQ